MNEIRIVGGKNKPAWKLILALTFSVLVIIALIIIALGSYSDGLNLPIFNNDPVVSRALHTLESAETKLRKNTDDTSAHLDRVRSWLVLGNIEGAELEWSKWKDSSQPDWGEIGRSLQELKTKTDEIRALLHEAETSTSPADKYPPIYALLGDIASRYEGIPKYRALFLKGYLLLREGRRGEAEPIFARELNNYEPLISYVRYNHARSVNVSGSEEKSLELFEKFIEEYPSSRIAPLAHLERINILKDLGKGDEAIVECRRLLDRYPKSAFAPKALRKWAEIHEERLEFDIGADIRVRIVREYPDTEEASATIDMFFGGLYALSLLNERDRLTIAFEAAGKRPSEALPVLAELADSQNLSAEDRAIASHGACRCEFSLGHYFDSIDWGNRAIELAPGSESADRAGIRNGWSYARLNK
ncbi:MAG TPA: tetratricopeptide repeat protein, partial [Firmicutes bacterium]|nr:tetratricopeptide repeat protein [Bacillota bacterium]